MTSRRSMLICHDPLSGATVNFSALPTLNKAFVIGPGYAPVPYTLVAEITGGQFIDLADLLPDNIRTQAGGGRI